MLSCVYSLPSACSSVLTLSLYADLADDPPITRCTSYSDRVDRVQTDPFLSFVLESRVVSTSTMGTFSVRAASRADTALSKVLRESVVKVLSSLCRPARSAPE